MKYFKWSFFFLICGMIIAFWRGESVQAGLGFKDLIAALIICSLEVSLSFDNAVVNAIKLEKMSAIWRKRFLTWGIAVAVFGMRFVFPIVIVAIFSGISCREVLNLALNNPDQYAHHLHEAHVGISSFGGAFLLMLFFEFMFEKGKEVHWISFLEKPLHKLGKIKGAPTVLTILALCAPQFFLTAEQIKVYIAEYLLFGDVYSLPASTIAALDTYVLPIITKYTGTASQLTIEYNTLNKVGTIEYLYEGTLSSQFNKDFKDNYSKESYVERYYQILHDVEDQYSAEPQYKDWWTKMYSTSTTGGNQ